MVADLKPKTFRFPGMVQYYWVGIALSSCFFKGKFWFISIFFFFNFTKLQKYNIFFYIGGCYVEGNYLKNAFRWKDTVGAWEERPGHYNDMWKYWTDDGFGYFEGLQVIFYVVNIKYFSFQIKKY